MKTHFSSRTLFALAVAVVTTLGQPIRMSAQPAPPAAADNALPPDIDPASPTAQVIKLVQAGTDISVINAFVANSASLFNLDADQIVALKDAGVPTDVINAMMSHDKNLGAQVPPPAPVPAPTPAPVPETVSSSEPAPPPTYAPAPAPDATPDTAPPPAPVTIEYFNNNLTPYGSWVDVNGYGRCWRPTVVIYDNNWSPYCDRGHWVYTDCGWYWSSDYSWGATFHYGRWFRDGRIGWCWHPDTEWAPSWVVWRSSSDYCGWAPLPPFAVFQPGVGFFYRGVSVAVDFNFGLDATCFVFLSPDHLCDRRPRSFCLDQPHVRQVFNHTTIINHFDSHDHVLVNRGIAVEQISARSHRTIETVKVGSLPNSRREGWQGAVTAHPVAPRNFSYQNQNNNNPSHGNPAQPQNHAPVARPNYNNNPPAVNHLENQGSQYNNYHPQNYSAPKTPAPALTPAPNLNNNHFNQENTRADQRTILVPATPAPPAEHYSSNPQMQQRVQQNQVHAYNGASGSRYTSQPQSSPSKGQSEGQDSGQGSSHDSSSDRQNH